MLILPPRALLIGAIVLASIGNSEAASDDQANKIAAYFRQCHAVKVCNGSFLVSQKGRILYQDALGDVSAEGGVQLTPSYAFDIGSVSKQFTAAAILKLQEQNKLSVDDPVAKFLPELPFASVTIRQLLSHTSGMPDVFPVYTEMLKSGKVSTPMMGDDAVAIIVQRKLALRFVPGSEYEYSNTGYILLSQIVSKASGLSYAQFLERNFFEPLGMRQTHLRLPAKEAAIEPRAFGFLTRVDGSRRAMDQIPNFYPVGAGGIYSTTRDLLKWNEALSSEKVISMASWRQMTEPTLLTSGKTFPYGFGLKLLKAADGQPVITHGGDWRGFKADLTQLPNMTAHIVLLTNNSQDDSVEAARDAVEVILSGKPAPVLRESVHWTLFRRSQELDAPALKRWLEKQHAQPIPQYDFPEQPLEQVADDLMRRGQLDKAIAVLEFNRDIHLQSLNALDNLADAYEEAGNLQAAIVQVERMLVIKPDSRRIREKLQKLKGLN